MTTPPAVEPWLTAQRRRSDLCVERLPITGCPDWAWDGTSWRHVQGRYFSVVGVAARIGTERLIEQPMIDQPEIGVLGFLVRCTGSAREWLLQAKTEPGNVLGTQVGPSVQATLSNYQRVHGGRATPMIECFIGQPPVGTRRWSDSLQSEQGDRFLGKYNRNALVELPRGHPGIAADAWAWFPAHAVRDALLADYAVNTDARSVMVCSPWDWLADSGATAFSRWRGRGGFGEALYGSFSSAAGITRPDAVGPHLEAARARHPTTLEHRAIERLNGWRIEPFGVFPNDDQASFSVQAFAVRASDREVSQWSQPLLVGGRATTVSLLCTRWDGVLHALLRCAAEPGLRDVVQLGPSDIDDPLHERLSWLPAVLSDPRCERRVAVRQSDEGGRFMRSAALYQVVEADPQLLPSQDADAVWLTLGQIQALALRDGQLTNEARSVLSLLLSWA